MTDTGRTISGAPDGRESASQDPVLDLVHLRSFTRGNRTFEAEVFDLFNDELAPGLARIAAEIGADAPWRMAVHRLKGSALGIGGRRLAAAARHAEAVAAGDPAARAAALATLRREAHDLTAEIARVRAAP
jgi:HPt (histidine-containing phosphotransfer) domain-containing protein